MPLPGWIGHVNKQIFNKIELKRGERPVVTHVGRKSGATYHTPLNAHPVENGYIFILMYGSSSDWVQNILSAGAAHLSVGDAEVELVSPRLVDEDVAWKRMAPETKRPADFLRVTEFLQMDMRAA